MWERWRQLRRSRATLFAVPIATMAGLLWLAILLHGRPIDAFTWTMLTVVLTCSALPGLFRLRRKTVVLLSLPIFLFGVYVVFPGPFVEVLPLERWSLCDDHGGRRGLQISPRLRFGGDGPNTALLESYLGPLSANWWMQAPLFPGIRDGNERVKSRNPILYEYLPAILARLPDNAARKQVLACLVDPENRLRVHQGLLLACLMELGYPQGLDAGGWWQAHRDLFECEHDPMVAAKRTRGWLRRIGRLPTASYAVGSLYSAARNQEHGEWGGHWDFGEAVRNHPSDEIKATANVVWWPCAPEALFGTGRITDTYLVRYAPDASEASRVPLYFVYSDPEFAFQSMVVEPNPARWPAFGRLDFKLDGRAAEAPIVRISDDELGVQIDNQVFRGLSKSKFLAIFRD